MATVQTRKLRESPPLRRPTEDEIKQAEEALRRIDSSTVRVAIRDEDGVESPVEIPPLALELLGQVLDELARGNAVTLEAIPRLLSVPQAAEMLDVSWNFVRELIEKGQLACERDETEPSVVFESVMDYQQKEYEARSKVLDELVAQAQELGMGY